MQPRGLAVSWCLLIVFFTSTLKVLATCPAYTIPENLKRPFIDVASTKQQASCTATSEDSSFTCSKALDEDVASEYKVRASDNSINSSLTITFAHKYLINTVRITQLQGATDQIESIKISFDNVNDVEYINLTKNAASQAKPETFSFSERLTKTIKLTILTLHDGTTGHGYKSIEVTNGMASSDKLCDYLEVLPSNTSKHVGVYSDTAVFSIVGTEAHAVLSTSTSSSSPRYVLRFGAVSNTKVQLDRFGPPGTDTASVQEANNVLSATQWRMFGIDFSSTAVALTIGNDLLLKHDDAANRIQIKYVSFYNPGSTSIKVLYCNREVKCYKEASHFWPFDKPNVADLITGKTLASEIKYIKPGPTFNGITSAAFSLTNNKLNLGDFAGKCLSNPNLCTKGLTIAFWFNVASSSSGTETLLSTDSGSPGIQVYFSSDEVHAYLYDGTLQAHAKSKAKKGYWNHVTVTWTTMKEMILMINFNSQTRATTSLVARGSDTNTILTVGAKNDLSGSADASISSLVIWEKSLDGHYMQKVGICTGISPVLSLEEGNHTSKIVPYDLLKASSDVGNTIYKGQLLYDDGTASSGAWQPLHTTPPTYIELDFVMGQPLAKTATQGGNNLLHWVKSYTLSYSWDGQEWTEYKINGSVYHFTANSDGNNIVSHLLCPKIEARLLRFHPVTWNTNIAMRVGVLVDGNAVDFKGCYSSASIDLTKPINDINPDELHPGKCVTSCAFQSANYAGLSHESRCYCFNTLPSNDVSRHKCNDPCKGNPSFKCGSLSYINVYGVRETLNSNFPISMPSKVKFLTPFKVTSSVHHRFSVDFGNGNIFSTNDSEISYFATNVDVKTIVADTWTSKYGTPKQLKTVRQLEVQWYLNGSKISYNKIVQVGKPVTFNVTVNEGSELKILRTKSNGEQQLYSIPDAMIQTTLKLDSTVTTSMPGSRSQDRFFVLSNSVFKNNGVLKAFTVHVMTPGYIKVQILRPVCIAEDEITYCYATGTCSSSVSQCTFTIPSSSPACSSGSVFCSSTTYCTQNNLVCETGQLSANVTLWSQYEVVHEVYTYLDKGQQLFLARNAQSTKDFEVRLGDLPAISLPANQSAEISMIKTSTRNHYQSNTIYKVQDLFQSSSLTSDVDYPDLQATYIVPSTFSLLDNCTTGNYRDVFNFSNSYNYEIVTANYACVERVSNVTWVHDLYLTARVPANVTVLAHPGNNVTHMIEYGDTRLIYHHERVDSNITYTVYFNHASNYSLTLSAFNFLGLEAQRCYVIVLERILAMDITKPSATIHGSVTQLQWTVHNGTDMQCNATLGEGTFRQTALRSVNGVDLLTINHTYPLAGEYFFNLTCFNPVSSLSNYTLVVVEVVVLGLTVNVIHAARDIEVNETVEIVAAITQGTNPIAQIDFGDGTSNLTRTLRSFKSYPTWGFFYLNVTVYNNVSSINYTVVIQVHKPVFPINITHITTKDTNFSVPSPFMMNVSSGNDFICDWDFGDGVVRRGASNFSTLGSLVYHTYNLDTCFNGKANCSNRLYIDQRAFTACVYHPITNLSFLVPSAHPSNLDMAISFVAVLGTSVSYNVTWKHILGSKINIPVTVSVDTKNGSGAIPQANFPGIGIYVAELSAINKVSSKVIKTQIVNVDIPILNLCAKASHVYIQVGLPVHFFAIVDTGSNVTVTWNFKDGSNETEVYRGDTLRLTGNNVSHAFAHHGVYEVSVTALNSLGSTTAFAVIYVQYPVKDLVITTNSPQIIPLGQTWFTLTVPTGAHPPTNATIDVDYELNGVDSGILFGVNKTSNFSKIITVPGIYFVNLTVRNDVSSQHLNTTIDVQREIKDFVVTPVHTAGDAGFGAPGRGPANNAFPMEYPVRFNASASDGSNVTFFVSYGDGSTNVTQVYHTTYFYPTKGTFTVTVIANNSVSQMKYNTSIVLMDSNVNLTFDNDSPTMFTDWTTITILLDKIGDDACCLVDLTNNTYRIYKDKPSTVCRSDWAALTSDQHVVPSKQNISITFSRKFWQLIYYWIKTSCHNTVSFLQEAKWVIVVPLPCNFPSVEILDLGRSYSKPRRFYRSESIKTYSDVVIICYASRESQFDWEINDVDPSGNKRRITELSQNSTTNRSVLVLPERSLPYGIYLLQVNVSLVGLPLVYTARTAYAEIIPSPLQCFVFGGNGWSQSKYRDIILDGKFSYDPDEQPSNKTAGIQYFLYCKREHSNYTFPDNPVTDTAELATGGGGCLNREAGLASKDLSIKTYDNGTFKVNDSLQFRLYCLKDSRLGIFDVFIKITETDPPHCALTMDGLTLKRLVIGTTKVTVEAICQLWGIDPSELLLSWTLHKKNNESKWDTLDIEKYVQSPTNRKYLVILPNVLDGCASYMAKIRAQLRGGPIGYTYIILDTHCPPRWGNCSVTPKEGTPETNFTFTCENWKDFRNETDLQYKYYYNIAPYNLPVMFAKTGKETTRFLHLPAGLEAFDYEVEVRIDIMDKEEAVTVEKLRVKVQPQADETSLSPCISLRKDIQWNGYLVQLEMEDSSKNLNAWYSQKLHLLNSESDDRLPNQRNLTSTLQEIKTFLDELPTLVSSGTPHPKTADVGAIENELRSLQIKSQECCQIRERIAKSLINIQLDSFSTVQMTSASMFLLTRQPDEQCVEAQVLLVVMLQKMMNFFQVESVSANFGELSKAMASFTQASEGILHGFATIIEKANSGNTTADLNNVAMAKYYSGMVLQLIRNTTDTIQCCIVQNEFPTRIFAPEINFTISKNTLDFVDGLSLYSGSGQVIIPERFASDVVGGNLNDTTRLVTSKSTVFLNNPFTGDNTSSKVHSYVSDFKLGNNTGSIVIGNLTKPLELWIQKKGSRTNCHQGTLRYHETQYIEFTVARNESSINIDVIDLLNLIDRPEFAVSVKRDVRPNRDDEWRSLPTTDGQGRTRNSLLYSSSMWNNSAAGDYYVAVKFNRTLTDREITEENGNNALNYSLCAFTSECIFWSKGVEKWTGEGCKVGPDSNLTHTQCLCTHATSFASDFVVPPNKIDWSKISLDELFKNWLVTAVLLSVVALYFLLLIPARRQDLKDLEKIGVIPIASNDPRDTYGYEVCLYTGFQAGMGTTAQVSIIISGSKEQTQPRILTDTDGKRPKFYRGAVDSFLVTTPYDLGQLGSIKIWHNHGGNNPSWFLSRLYIRDLQTDKKTWYICNRWFAVEEDDGKIERVLHTATNKELTSFNLLFSTEARKNFSDSHLWFSVYYRPPQSTFTRVQRMTCCLCVLLSTMLANAMFYQTGGNTPNAEVVLGPFRFSTQQISIAITSSLVVLPINLLIMNLFRKARLKNPPSENAINKFYIGDKAKEKRNKDQDFEEEEEREEEEEEEEEEAMEDDDYEVIAIHDEKSNKKMDKQKKKEEKKKKKEEKKEKEPMTLPYWVIYIAYVLAFLTCAASSLFTIFYSLTFGKEKSEGWLSAMMISFWQDVLISQPIKVLAIAMILALIIKDPDRVDDGTIRSAELGHDEEWIHRDPDSNEKVRLENFIPRPPGEDTLYEPRQRLLKQKEMKAIIKEIVVYFIYIMVLCIVANGNTDPQAYHMTKFTSEVFAGSSYAGSSPLYAVGEPVNYWYWLHQTVIPSLKPKYWYGPYVDEQEEQLWTEQSIKRTSRRGWKVKIHKRTSGNGGSGSSFDNSTVHKFPKNFIADSATAYVIGSARLRLLKVKPGNCEIHTTLKKLFYSCSALYTWEKEDERAYLPGWVAVNETMQEELKKDERSPWVWRSAWELKGTPYWGAFNTYWGGGYVANVDPSRIETIKHMQKLELEIWIDRYTRAIFTEFALYNAYSNFFCVVTMLSEIIPTGGYHHYVQFRPIRLYRYTGPEQLVIMAFEIIYMAFLLMFTYSEVKELYRRKKKYFEDPWNYLEFLVIGMSFSAIGLYFARLGFGKFAVKRMKENPHDFISFTYVLLLDEYQVATLGFAVFFAILKSLRLLRFNRRMSLLTQTVKACGPPLLSFFIMFMVIFLAFVQFAVIVFGENDENYSSFSKCLSTMMSFTLGGFDFEALMANNRVFGPIFFFAYILYVNMIIVNVFLAIINDTLAEVASDVDLQPNDYEIVDFMMHQIKLIAGWRVGPAIPPLYKPTKTKFAQEVEAVESLAENIEYALSNTIVEDERQNNWLKRENMTRKKLILFKAVLRLEEDYNEDDLSNLIPLMEEFLIRHSDNEVARIILGESSECSDGSAKGGEERDGCHDYEQLNDPTGSDKSFIYAHLYDNVGERSTMSIKSSQEDDESELDFEVMVANENTQEDHRQIDDLTVSEPDTHAQESKEKDDSQSVGTFVSEISMDSESPQHLTPVEEALNEKEPSELDEDQGTDVESAQLY